MPHANENIAGKGHHEFVPAKPAADPLAKTGYVAKPYEHQEYPKWVGDKLVNNAAEEAAAQPQQAEEKPAE